MRSLPKEGGLVPAHSGRRRVDIVQCVFFFQAEDGIRDVAVTGVQTCALPIFAATAARAPGSITPMTGTGDFSWSELSACAVLVLQATTTALTPRPKRYARISAL